MPYLLSALLAALAISAISLAGVALIRVRQSRLQRLLLVLVSFSTGALLGGGLLHLLPEAVELMPGSLTPFLLAVAGFAAFFLLEKALRIHHCHDGECATNQHIGTLNLVGDAVHNFIDGLILVSAFAVSPGLGVVVAVSVIVHEVPQELGDFGVLLYAGFSRSRALLYNFLTALTALLGVLVGYVFINAIDGLSALLLPVAAGGFLYIAAADLIPELHKDSHSGRAWWSTATLLLALAAMWGLKVLGVE